MSTMVREAFLDELEKIGKAEKPKEIPDNMIELRPSLIERSIQGGMGAGLASSQAPLAARYLRGKGTFYHGTPLKSAIKILQHPEGVDPNFAGAGHTAPVVGDKAARFNRHIMANSPMRILEEHGIELGDEAKVRAMDAFNSLMDKGVKARDAANTVFSQEVENLAEGLAPEAAKSLRDKLNKGMSAYGLRSYWGDHPAAIKQWASNASEAEMAAEHLARRSSAGPGAAAAKSIFSTLTGGLPTLASDTLAKMKYKPKEVVNMTRDQAVEHLRGLSKNHSAIFGAEIPTGQMGYLEDYPGVKHLLSLNPGYKHQLKDLGITTYEPGRDLSIPHSVKPNAFKLIDVVDKSTGDVVKRIHLSDAERAAASPILQRLGRAALPTALTALGAYGLYRAVKPKPRLVPKNSFEGLMALQDQENSEKTGSVASDVGSVAKYVLPTTAIGTALGIGGGALSRKLIPIHEDEPTATITDKALLQGKHVGRQLISTALPYVAGGSLGALAGYLAHRRLGMPSSSLGATLGASVGAGAIGLAGSIAGSGYNMDPSSGLVTNMLPDKTKEYLRKNPWISSVTEGATTAALPIGAAYMLRKYYPGHFARAAMGVRRIVSSLKGLE